MSSSDEAVRLDQWLVAARLFKTRAFAARAIDGGKVELNGHPAKRGKVVHRGDRVRVRKGPFVFFLEVQAISKHRGAPSEAAALYTEDPAGRAVRERLAHQLRVAPPPAYEGKGRPTKRDRRDLERLRGDDD